MRQIFLSILTVLAYRGLAASYPMTLDTLVDEQGIHGVAYQQFAPKGWPS